MPLGQPLVVDAQNMDQICVVRGEQSTPALRSALVPLLLGLGMPHLSDSRYGCRQLGPRLEHGFSVGDACSYLMAPPTEVVARIQLDDILWDHMFRTLG